MARFSGGSFSAAAILGMEEDWGSERLDSDRGGRGALSSIGKSLDHCCWVADRISVLCLSGLQEKKKKGRLVVLGKNCRDQRIGEEGGEMG